MQTEYDVFGFDYCDRDRRIAHVTVSRDMEVVKTSFFYTFFFFRPYTRERTIIRTFGVLMYDTL